MRVVVAIPDAGPFVERLIAGGHTEVAVLAPDVMIGAARERAGATEALVEADVVVLAASRAWLTREVVELCDRAATRIVAWARDPSERRFAEVLGVAVVDAGVDALDAVTALPSPRQPGRSRGRVIVVWGAAGAPGRTTLSIELARETARDGRRVALADADTHAPSVAIALGIADEGPGLAAACRRASRGELTPAELTRIAEPAGAVEVLTGINRTTRWPELGVDRVLRALDTCRDWVDDVFVDVSASLERDEEIVSDLDGPRRNGATLAALESADLVVAVAGADPVGLSRFLRAYPDLRATAGAVPVHVVVNKLRGGPLGVDPRGQIRRSFERYAGIERCWFVPWDPRAADAALLAARPIGEGNGRGPLPAAVRRFVGEAIAPPTPFTPAQLRRQRVTARAAAVRSAP
jgi:MinD-like ATPase involved in chromosome partitioning or flagellar assembly